MFKILLHNYKNKMLNILLSILFGLLCCKFTCSNEEEDSNKRYSIDLESSEQRQSFAQRLRDALHREISITPPSSEEDSNYAVGISIDGSQVADHNIKVCRGGSIGFALEEDSLDESFLQSSFQQEHLWINNFKTKQRGLSWKKSNQSSEYSFSTDCSSELEEVYEQFSRWLTDPAIETEKGMKNNLDGRDLAVVRFAGSILKRTLSESFAGIPVPMAENCSSTTSDHYHSRKNKLVLNAKSLSLELARQRHRLASQLSKHEKESDVGDVLHTNYNLANNRNYKVWIISCVNEAIVQTLEDVKFRASLPSKLSEVSKKPSNGLKSIATGNWGCGSSHKGDVQLKVIIQWLAASVSGVPSLIYYTAGHEQLTKLDTVTRILIDRKWSVKDLTQAALRYSNQVLHGNELSGTLFEKLIGV